METLRIAEELERQTVQPKHGNVNRYSKDSGVVDIELLKPFDLVTAATPQHDSDHSQHAGSTLVVSGDGQWNKLLLYHLLTYYLPYWTIVIHCSTACLMASSIKFTPSRMPPLGFSLELDEGTTSRKFCISCTGFLYRDVSTSNWHVSFTGLCLARHLRTWLMTYACFRKVQGVSSARPPTDHALFHAHTTHLATSFTAARPRVWNSLPVHCRDKDITYVLVSRRNATSCLNCAV